MSQTSLISKQTVITAVEEELAKVDFLISMGKGVWPTPSYVRDSQWDGWLGEQRSLRNILGKLGKL